MILGNEQAAAPLCNDFSETSWPPHSFQHQSEQLDVCMGASFNLASQRMQAHHSKLGFEQCEVVSRRTVRQRLSLTASVVQRWRRSQPAGWVRCATRLKSKIRATTDSPTRSTRSSAADATTLRRKMRGARAHNRLARDRVARVAQSPLLACEVTPIRRGGALTQIWL